MKDNIYKAPHTQHTYLHYKTVIFWYWLSNHHLFRRNASHQSCCHFLTFFCSQSFLSPFLRLSWFVNHNNLPVTVFLLFFMHACIHGSIILYDLSVINAQICSPLVCFFKLPSGGGNNLSVFFFLIHSTKTRYTQKYISFPTVTH